MTDSSPPQAPLEDKLRLSTKLAYGAGDMGAAITANILAFFLLFFFTNVAGLGAGLAGSILLISKIWDAVNDPVVGVWSDRTYSRRWGRRYPWMLYGAIPFGITFFLQWIVPRFSSDPGINQWSLFWYYIVIALLFNTFYTMVNLPYTALTPELTQDYNERTSLNSFRFAFSIGGSILSVLLVIVIAAAIPDLNQQYLLIGAVCAILSVLPIYWCIWGTKDRVLRGGVEQPAPPEANIPILEQLRIALSNRPFLYVIGIYLCSWLAVQLTASILKYFVINWMGYSDQVSNVVILAVQATALIMLFVWSAISRRVGKKAVYFMGMGVWIIAQAGLFFLQPGQLLLMYGLAILAGFGVSTAYLIPWSMLPDVIELDELQTGQRREGVFYAFIVLLQKVGLAIGLFLVGQTLEMAGFVEAIPGQPVVPQPESALWAIRVAIGPLPTLFLVIGLVITYFYPITREVHAEILLKLRERKQGLPSQD